jgi:enediyne biosynthesis protein E4
MSSRRDLLLSLAALPIFGQGVSTRTARPTPRGKASGLPFNSKLTDIAAEAGLRAPVIYGGADRKTYIVETVGCGVAFIDYDNDGWLDIFILGGKRFDEPTPESTNRLYRNNRDGTFTDVTEKAGLHKLGWASSVCVGDYDNDGFDDLFVTFWGQNVLYRNNGDGTFTDVTEKAGLLHPARRWCSGASFFQSTRNGRLDLVVATYVDFHPEQTPKPGENPNCNWKGIEVNCGPRGLPPGRVYLYRNNGDGTFTDVSEQSGVAKLSGSYCMTVTCADFANSGWQDIFIACDSTPSFFLRNKGDGTFEDIGLESGVALNEDGMEQAGMGVGVGDFNLDGKLDIFKTHFADDTNILYLNSGKDAFEDVTIRANLGVEVRYTGWGAGIVDLDNNGFPDLFLVTGSVYPEIAKKLSAYPLKTPRVVFRNLGNGRFEELIDQAGPGVAAVHCSRGCAFGDFDNDGDVDMVIVNLNEPPSLLRNDVTGNGNWLKVKLVGEKSNRSAIGARVTARYGTKIQAQQVMSQASFFSANDKRLHFGLGSAETVDLEIQWPNGAKETVKGVEPNRLVTIREGSGVVKTESFPLDAHPGRK